MDWILSPFSKLILNKPQINEKKERDSNLDQIYHEKQVKELCAVHALNNLFQEKFYSKATLDKICTELSPQDLINPHRSFLGRGNYNVNIIMKAVQYKYHEVVWFDKRKPLSTLNLNKIKGFILNISSDFKIAGIGLPWEIKHWVAITNINNTYYNLDSKLGKPEQIGDDTQLLLYLENAIKSKDKELILVVPKEAELEGTWKK